MRRSWCCSAASCCDSPRCSPPRALNAIAWLRGSSMTITRRWWWALVLTGLVGCASPEAALGESGDVATWDAAVPRPAADRPVKAPLLARTRIVLDGRAARSWVRRLLKRSDRMNPRTIDAVALLEAAVCQDDARSDALAVAAGADPHALRVVGQMAALPLLQACGRALGRDLPGSWWEGYCPLCGA